MKVVNIDGADLTACVEEAQHEQVMITRNGRPIALVVGLADMDEEQMQLVQSDKFWKLIIERRSQRRINRAELERKLA